MCKLRDLFLQRPTQQYFTAGEFIPVTGRIGLIVSGVVSITHALENGERIMTRLLTTSDLLNILPACGDDYHTLIDCTIKFIPMERMDRVRADIIEVLLKESQANNQVLKEHILNVSGVYMVDRIKWVLTLLNKAGFFNFNKHLDGERRLRQAGFGPVVNGTLPIFAKMLGTPVETISRGLTKLRTT